MSFKVMTSAEMIAELIAEGGTDTVLPDGSHFLTHPNHQYGVLVDTEGVWSLVGKNYTESN